MNGRAWGIVVVAVVVYILFMVIASPPPSRPTGPSGSSVSATADGARAIAKTFDALGMPFRTSTIPPVLLSAAGEQGLLVAVAPDGQYLTDKDVTALVQWVSTGHDVLWVTQTNDPFLNRLGFRVSTLLPANRVTAIRKGMGTTPRTFDFPVSADLYGKALAQANTEYVSEDGIMLGATMNLGRGQVTVWTAPAPFENGWIGKADNFQIAWTLIDSRAVLWDEYTHGVSANLMFNTMFSHGRQWAIGAFVLAAFAFIWVSFSRFGAIQSALDERPRLRTELVDAMAWHLRRTKH